MRDQIQIIHDDLKNMPEKLGHNRYDVVTCNPPYFKTPKQTEQNMNEHLRIARHEIHCTLEDVISVSDKAAQARRKGDPCSPAGTAFGDFELMKAYQIEPKRVQFVYPKQGKEANTILVEGIKGGRPDLKILPLCSFMTNKMNIQKKSGPFYMETNNHFFYVVKCKDNSWYAGYTNDLQKRVKTHNDGKGAKYTKVRRPVELIFAEAFTTKREAMQAEYYFKN